ncbi:MAG: anhydro-N-acetylmuramic acid kinase [Gammaproteobacteria bacterium]
MADRFVGLMSGTSADAVDAVLASIDGSRFVVEADLSTPIPADLQTALRDLARAGDIDQLGSLDVAVGELFAHAVLSLLDQAGVDAGAVRAIGSHGQTARHRPRAERRFTLQIGDPNIIAARTGITTVADFRRRDVALGGQGAPLVPAFHAAVLADPAESRAVLNIGGIGNVTRLVPGQPVTGFDTGPGNVLMDAWARRHLGTPWDESGRWAASGTPDAALLDRLMTHPFLALAPPKSTGPEDFSLEWLDGVLASDGGRHDPATVQATLAEFTATTVGRALEAQPPDRILVCGGGARNPHLLRRIAAHGSGAAVETTEAAGIAPDLVEASAFAWLASRTLAGLAGNVPSVTGARQPAILGGIYPGAPPAVRALR